MATSTGEVVKEENGQDLDYDEYFGKVVVKDAPMDQNLLRMDREFNDSFEKRMSRNIVNMPDLQFVHDGDDLHKTITIFRKVAQKMGDEWKPVFKELMKGQKEDLVEQEITNLETHKALIQGYRSLMVWKEFLGNMFHISKLIDALRVNKMDEIAQEVLFMTNDKYRQSRNVNLISKPSKRKKRLEIPDQEKEQIDNKTLLLMAKKLSNEWKELGETLKIETEEMKDIETYPGAKHEKSFKVLWSWKENNKESDSLIEDLKKMLIKMDHKDIVDEFLPDKN